MMKISIWKIMITQSLLSFTEGMCSEITNPPSSYGLTLSIWKTNKVIFER